jgi:type IV pilus biogenesis protein CpaD/CtpE
MLLKRTRTRQRLLKAAVLVLMTGTVVGCTDTSADRTDPSVLPTPDPAVLPVAEMHRGGQ